MIDKDNVGPFHDWQPDSETQALLDAQRGALKSAFSGTRVTPKVGDIWLSGAHWVAGAEEGLSAMLVVLRTFAEVWSSQPLFDVAPVSEDERLATEWSLILGARDSGLGMSLVLHVDVQCTTTSSMLIRRIGALSEFARLDLETLLRAYALGDGGTIDLRVGRVGRISIRFHPEWDVFSRHLLDLSQAFAAPIALQRAKQEDVPEPLDGVESARYPSLEAASGADPSRHFVFETCRWEYRSSSPFLFCEETLEDPPASLGSAIAFFYSNGCGNSTFRRPLERAAFARLEPLFNVSLTPLVANPSSVTVHAVLCGSVGKPTVDALEQEDLQIVVESVRCVVRRMGLNVGARPMRLAARRPSTE